MVRQNKKGDHKDGEAEQKGRPQRRKDTTTAMLMKAQGTKRGLPGALLADVELGAALLIELALVNREGGSVRVHVEQHLKRTNSALLVGVGVLEHVVHRKFAVHVCQASAPAPTSEESCLQLRGWRRFLVIDATTAVPTSTPPSPPTAAALLLESGVLCEYQAEH